MLSKDLKASVKTVIGSCGPMGILIESKPLDEVTKEVDEGKYDELINSGNTEVSDEKLKQLNADLKEINIALESRYSKELAKIEEDKEAAAAPAEGEEAAKEGDSKEEKK